ncbi:MAG: DNA polymerase III subunit beta [Candidatus Omnitrophica bacterium]|nr:DNA polymerase III subunit beta [Candidatus Omnitrophota bacterium]
MKIKLQKKDLIYALQKVQGIITTKSTLPIISYILLTTQEDILQINATDLDIGIKCRIPMENIESGGICLPARRFFEIIRELPFDDLEITTKKNNLTNIKTKSCEFKIIGLNPEEFPKLPEFKEGQCVKIKSEILKKAISLTSFAVSLDETRYILNGILLYFYGNNFNMVATDGKRLAIKKEELHESINKEIKIIVPIKAIRELERNLEDTEEVLLVFGKNQIGFELGNINIISRLIEGDFPDYQQVIPVEVPHKVIVNRQLFLGAIRRAALLTTPDYQAVKLEVFKNKLVVSKSTPDIGESYEELSVEYEGKEMLIGFNPDYLIDVFKNLEDENIAFELTESEKPAVIRKSDYIYIVLPMRLG